ncbi:MAG: iron-sulfur cluster assembly scaffold protein [Candidatus Omnitrophica bacterium]|nr:iron-sulfur cluster assembly scaffold protein [Candidatus Omnitrophota bacterium]
MPCNDSSSGLNIHLDSTGRLIKFEFAKITCSREIAGGADFNAYCRGKTLEEILQLDLPTVARELNLGDDEEKQFIFHLEWAALRSGIVQYLGIDHPTVDMDRCRISSIDYSDDAMEIAFVILPPREMPKILPCSLADKGDEAADPKYQ